MSEKMLLIIAGIFDSVLAISPMFIDLPFIALLALAAVPVVACIPMFGAKK